MCCSFLFISFILFVDRPLRCYPEGGDAGMWDVFDAVDCDGDGPLGGYFFVEGFGKGLFVFFCFR